MSTIEIFQPRQRVLADIVPRSWIMETTLVVGAAALVGLLAQVSFTLPLTPIPFTGQTLGVMLVGTALGWRRAFLSMSLYLIAGLAGVPWYAQHAHGYIGGSFGFIVGFVVAGAVLGWFASRGTDRNVARSFVAMAIGDAIIFAFGLTWLGLYGHYTLAQTFAYGFTPFVWGELIKAGIAGVALPSSWRLVDRMTK